MRKATRKRNRFYGSSKREILLTASRVLTPAAVFLRVEGAASEGITIDGGDISKAAAPLAFESGAAKTAVKLRRISAFWGFAQSGHPGLNLSRSHEWRTILKGSLSCDGN
jgi:hypothetical protein